jgi:hypothetical protein
MDYDQSNWLIDEVMPKVKPNTFKIIAAVARKTWGWNKADDVISMSQLLEMTGISSKSTLDKAIKDALETGYIVRAGHGKSFKYSMVIGTETVPSYDNTYENCTDDKYRNRTDNGTETVHTNRINNKNNIHRPAREENQTQPATDSHLQPLVTALATTSKTTLWTKTKDEFDDAALVLFGFDATPKKINEFGQAWQKHGYYPGKPALKTIVNEYRNWLSGAFREQQRTNGSSNGRYPAANSKREALQQIQAAIRTGISRGTYQEAVSQLNGKPLQIFKQMGKWRDIKRMNDKEVEVTFYQTYNGAIAQ